MGEANSQGSNSYIKDLLIVTAMMLRRVAAVLP